MQNYCHDTRPKVTVVSVRDSDWFQKTIYRAEVRCKRRPGQIDCNIFERAPRKPDVFRHICFIEQNPENNTQILIRPPLFIWTFHVTRGAAGIGSFPEALLFDLKKRERKMERRTEKNSSAVTDTPASTGSPAFTFLAYLFR